MPHILFQPGSHACNCMYTWTFPTHACVYPTFLCTIRVNNRVLACAQLSQRPVVGNVHRELFELAMQALSRICISPTAPQPLGLRVLRSRLLRGVQMMLQVPQCMSYLLSDNCAAQRQALLQLSVSSPALLACVHTTLCECIRPVHRISHGQTQPLPDPSSCHVSLVSPRHASIRTFRKNSTIK
jgi:hypothetical protein